MKIIKVIMLLTSVSFFTSVSTGAKARDCSNPEGFHEKMMCKIAGEKVDGATSDVKKVKKEKKEWKQSEFNEKNKTLYDLLNKD